MARGLATWPEERDLLDRQSRLWVGVLADAVGRFE